jgi:NADPH:quinone reductase-like Zn-dependent oxidoreductase
MAGPDRASEVAVRMNEVSSPPGPISTVRAWSQAHYGLADQLVLRDLPPPPFRDDNEVLVRVRATSVNPADKHNMNLPFFLRMGHGFLRPKEGRPGLDFSGWIEQVRAGVHELQVGDEVFGVARGAFGEYAVADQSQIAIKPSKLTFEQAAAVPIAATTALQGLRDHGKLQPGQRVLINGASGGVGTFAVQLARAMGAEVSCVCSPGNVEQARSLGATRVFDYSKEDFTRSGARYDLILDSQLNHSLAGYRRVLTPQGLLLVVGAGPGSISRLLGRLITTSLAAKIVGPRTKFFIAKVSTADLRALAVFLDAGTVTPVIDRSFPLDQVPDALRYLAAGHARGKIVITV